jgi:hypothetical protein
MFSIFEKAVLGMAVLRLISGSIEITAAILMLKFNQIEKALIVNSSLALIGPFVLILTTTIGFYGIVGSISYTKMACVFLGVCLILFGVLKS